MPKLNTMQRAAGMIEPGMWVVDSHGRVGVAGKDTLRDADGIVTGFVFYVALVKEDGTNKLDVACDPAYTDFKIAPLSAIPAKRIEGVPVEKLNALGYF